MKILLAIAAMIGYINSAEGPVDLLEHFGYVLNRLSPCSQVLPDLCMERVLFISSMPAGIKAGLPLNNNCEIQAGETFRRMLLPQLCGAMSATDNPSPNGHIAGNRVSGLRVHRHGLPETGGRTKMLVNRVGVSKEVI